MRQIGIIATASYIPPTIQTNEEVCQNIMNLSPQWIIEKIGIKKRHIAKGEEPSEMAGKVATTLATDVFGGTYPIDLIIVCSFTQDYMLPPMSAKIHSMIGAQKDCQIIDINTNCTGLITGMIMAVERLQADHFFNCALVIGVEKLSSYVDKTDKFTAPFFSDGASGVLIGNTFGEGRYIDSFFCTDSSAYEDVRLKRGGLIEHNGKETWTQAITNLPYVMKKLLERQEMSFGDVDFFIFHQANKVLIDYIMDKNRILPYKTYTNVEEIGNTGAASIGIALDEAVQRGHIKSGMTVMMAGVGAGFNFGASLWKM